MHEIKCVDVDLGLEGASEFVGNTSGDVRFKP
jgi:hypothetical protein